MYVYSKRSYSSSASIGRFGRRPILAVAALSSKSRLPPFPEKVTAAFVELVVTAEEVVGCEIDDEEVITFVVEDDIEAEVDEELGLVLADEEGVVEVDRELLITLLVVGQV